MVVEHSTVAGKRIRDTATDPPSLVLAPTITVWNAVLLQWETLPGSRFMNLDARFYPKWVGETVYAYLSDENGKQQMYYTKERPPL